MKLLFSLAALAIQTRLALSCTPEPLANGNFETGSIAPWAISDEYNATVTPSTTAFNGSKYSANFTIVYTKEEQTIGQLPTAGISQTFKACGAHKFVSYWYNIPKKPTGGARFNPAIYNDKTSKGKFYSLVDFDGNSDVDSLGNAYGQWHQVGPVKFNNTKDDLDFSVVFYGLNHIQPAKGSATILLDNVVIS